MSDVIGSALIQIEPDFSQFEQTLTRGLQQAADRAAKSAKIQFNSKEALASTEALVVATSTLNTTIQNLNKSISALNTSYSNQSARQRNYNRQTQQSVAETNRLTVTFTKLQKAIFIGSQFLQAAQSVNELADRYQGFNQIRARVIGAFAKDGPEIENIFTRARDAVGEFFSGVERVDRSTKTIRGFGNQLIGTEERIVRVADGVKTTETRISNAAGIITKSFTEVSGEAVSAATKTVKGFSDTKRAAETATKSVRGFSQGAALLADYERRLPILTRLTNFTSASVQNLAFHADRLARNFGQSALGGAIDGISTKLRILVSRGGPLGQVLGAIGTRLAALGPAGAAGLAVAGITLVSAAFGKAIVSMAQKASNLQESINAVDVTLGEAAPKFKELIGDTSRLGVTQLELNEALTPIIPLLQDAGKSGDDLAKGLNELSRRAVDLGSIFNQTTNQVLVKLGAAIRGEIEPARALGVTFNAAAVEAEAAALGFEKVDGQLSEQAKTLARFNLVLEKTTFAAGDYERTSEGLANATRNFQSVLAELGFEFSAVFLPAAEKIRAAMNRLVTEVGPLASGFFERITPLVTQFGEVIADVAIDGLGRSFVEAASAAGTVFNPAVVAVTKSLELLLNVFEAVNVVTGRILPGNINLLTVGLTNLLIVKQVDLAMKLLIPTLNALSSALLRIGTAQAGVAIGRFAASLSAAAGPIGAAITAIALITSGLQQMKQEARGAAAAITQGLDPSQFDALDSGLEAINQRLEENRRAIEKTPTVRVFGKTLLQFGSIKKEQEAINALEKERQTLLQRSILQETILSNVAAQTGKTVGEVFEKAKELGISFVNLPLDKGAQTIEKLVSGFEKVTKSAKDVAAAIRDGLDGLESMNKQIQDSDKRINDLITERVKLVRDVITRKLEEFNAAKAVRDLERQIQDTARERADQESRLLDIAEQRQEIEQRFNSIAQERLEIERQIQELLAPTDPEDISSAQDALTRSQFNLNKAKREQLKLEEELLGINKENEELQVDLTGLSLDEARSKIASARAAAAARRARKGEEETSSDLVTDEEKRELAAISVRDAQRDLVKQQESLNKLLQPEINNREEIQRLQERLTGLTKEEQGLRKQLTSLTKDEESVKLRIQRIDQDAPGLILQKQAAERTLQQTLSGEIGIQQQIRGLDQQITQEKRNQKDLIDQQRRAIDDLFLSEDALNRKVNERFSKRLEELGLMDEAQKRLLDLVRLDAPRTVKAAVRETLGAQADPTTAFGRALSQFIDRSLSPQILEKITAALILDPGADLREVIKSILRQTGIVVPGFAAEGAVIPGAPGPLGQLMHVGEYGRPEAILPLTKPSRFMNVLQQSMPYAHPSIQSAIGRISGGLEGVPNSRSGAMISSGGSRVPFQSAKPTPTEQKLDRLIQLMEESNHKEFKVEAPISVTTKDPDRAARKMVRELERRLERRR